MKKSTTTFVLSSLLLFTTCSKDEGYNSNDSTRAILVPEIQVPVNQVPETQVPAIQVPVTQITQTIVLL